MVHIRANLKGIGIICPKEVTHDESLLLFLSDVKFLSEIYINEHTVI